MVINHSAKTVKLESCELESQDFYAIGRLVRACATIEDACHSYLSSVSRTAPATLSVLLGQLDINRKLGLALNLANTRGQLEVVRFNSLFDTERLSEVLKCRNATAHGFLLGRWPSGKWAFETTTKSSSDRPGEAAIEVYSFGSDDIKLYAIWAEDIAATASADLYIHGQQQKRRRLSLPPSQKAR